MAFWAMPSWPSSISWVVVWSWARSPRWGSFMTSNPAMPGLSLYRPTSSFHISSSKNWRVGSVQKSASAWLLPAGVLA